MALESGRAVSSRVRDRSLEERRGDTDCTVTLIDGETHDPPGARIVGENPLEHSVALDAWDLRTWHHTTPSDGNIVNIGHKAGRHDCGRDLGAEGLTIVRRAGIIDGVEQPLAPTPTWLVAATTERTYDIVPSIWGRSHGREFHDAASVEHTPGKVQAGSTRRT
jgi:hypothetical protein